MGAALPPKARWRGRCLAAGLGLGWLITRADPAQAHELSFDQLRLRPSPAQASASLQRFDAGSPRAVRPLSAELLLRAEHDEGKPTGRAERLIAKANVGVEVLALHSSGVWAEIDMSWTVRELWQPGGAVAGDLLVGRGALPTAAQALRVALHPPLGDVAVLVTAPSGERAGQIDGVWLREGASPPYLLSANAQNSSWNEAAAVLDARNATAPLKSSRSARQSGWLRTGSKFLSLGIQHVIPDGPDHALFVALIALSHLTNFRSLVLEISLFTLAHLMALIAMRQGWVATPGPWIEPAIALSILLMALDCFRRAGGSNGRVHSRWRKPVIAGFGLWHGLGFAGSLAALPLATGQELPALASFNLGVELGQLSVAFVLWGLTKYLVRSEASRQTVVRAISLLAALVALWWLVQRTIRASG